MITTEIWRSLKMGLPLIWARHTYSPRSSLFTFSKCSALSESCRTRSPSEVRQSIKALTRWNTHWNTTTLILCYCKGGLRSISLWVCSGCMSAYFSTKPVSSNLLGHLGAAKQVLNTQFWHYEHIKVFLQRCFFYVRQKQSNIMNLMLKVQFKIFTSLVVTLQLDAPAFYTV